MAKPPRMPKRIVDIHNHLWGADSNDQQNLITRCRKALVKLGYGPHLDKIFYANARGILEKLGVFPRG